ncbi:hypothetical protein ANCCAN_27913 [Ancylostoma caninum]|uniref:Uncharacterized protein n=1 Tax=Ancylostoma caninum TaxID=29170 RepID=A0A368F2N2_ANCCA|nr:hypothetical protein ANCCAN_27913 [Ancylostoma caninum]
MYLKVKADVPLSSYTSALLEDYTPNKLQFPLAPRGDKGDSAQFRSGKVVHKESSEKVLVDKALESGKNKKYVDYSFYGSSQKSGLDVLSDALLRFTSRYILKQSRSTFSKRESLEI